MRRGGVNGFGLTSEKLSNLVDALELQDWRAPFKIQIIPFLAVVTWEHEVA